MKTQQAATVKERDWDSLPSVQATLNYAPDDFSTGSAEKQIHNTLHLEQSLQKTLPIHDARSIRSSLSLDNEGFVLAEFDAKVADYNDPEQTDKIWTPAIKAMLKDLTGATHIASWGALVRYSTRAENAPITPATVPFSNVHSDFGPGQFVGHIDHGDAQAAIKKEIGVDQPRRWKCINIWTPISEPPYDSTLAVCDVRTVSPDDVVSSFIQFDDPKTALPFVLELPRYRYNPAHRWAYFSDMRPGEALVFIGLDDTAHSGVRMAPHTSIVLPGTPANAAPRKSIETRVVAIFDE